MKSILTIAWVFLLLPAHAQEPKVSFEVATIKPTPQHPPLTGAEIAAGRRRPIAFEIEGDRVDVREMDLRFTLGRAYRVRPIYVFGEDWLDTKFDIAAKMPAGASPSKVPEMLQALLTERFGVRLHKETRSMPVYVLTIAKGGAKLKEVPPDTPDAVKNSLGMMIMVGTPDAIGAAASFAGLQLPLIDQTGLRGKYEIPIESALVFANMAGRRNEVDDSDAVDRMRQILQPLGLNINSERIPTEVVVVDHIEHTPSGN